MSNLRDCPMDDGLQVLEVRLICTVEREYLSFRAWYVAIESITNNASMLIRYEC